MKIYLCRHGETEWNLKEIYQGQFNSDLTEKGVAQAHRVAAFLEDKEINVLLCSPLKRAQETAHVISKKVGLQIVTIEEMKEMSFGDFHGRERDKVRQEQSDFFKNREGKELETPYPAGESYLDLTKRIHLVVDKIPSQGTIALVGHNFINKALRGALRDLLPSESFLLSQNNNEILFLDTDKGEAELESIL